MTAETSSDKSAWVLKDSGTCDTVTVGGALVNLGSCNGTAEEGCRCGRCMPSFEPKPMMDNVVTTVTVGHHCH